MKQWYKIHKYTGYIGGIVFFLLCFSGLVIMLRGFSFSNIEKEIYSAHESSMWNNSQNQINTILAEHPNYTLRSMAIRPETSLISFRFTEKNNKEIIRYHYYIRDGQFIPANNQMVPRHVDMDYTAVIVRTLARFHSNLLLGDTGRVLLLLFSLVSLVTCFAGYKIYRKINLSPKRGMYSLHTFLGIVVSPYCIILFVSGILLIGHSYFSRVYYADSAVGAEASFASQQKTASVYTYSDIFDLVKNKYPDKEVLSLDIPSGKDLSKPATSTYHLCLIDKSELQNAYQGYFVADDLWVWAYKSPEFISYITSPRWYMSILAVGVDLHFKNHGHPALEIIWLIYLDLSCALLLLLFIKPLRRVQIVMNNRYSFGWGTFILNCGYLFLPLFGQIGVYIGIVCGLLSFVLIGLNIKNIIYKKYEITLFYLI